MFGGGGMTYAMLVRRCEDSDKLSQRIADMFPDLPPPSDDRASNVDEMEEVEELLREDREREKMAIEEEGSLWVLVDKRVLQALQTGELTFSMFDRVPHVVDDAIIEPFAPDNLEAAETEMDTDSDAEPMVIDVSSDEGGDVSHHGEETQ